MAEYSNDVIDQYGRPIIGALVTAVQGGMAIATANTDGLGQFTIIAPDGIYTLQVRINGSLVLEYDNVAIGAVVPVLAPIIISGPTTPIAGSIMKIDYLSQGTTPLPPEAGIWAGPTYSHVGESWDFTSTDGSGADAPAFARLTRAVNDSSTADVVALGGITLVKASNGRGFGANIIARTSGTGITDVHLVGQEIDWVVAAGDTVANTSGALAINAFGAACPFAIQFGGTAFGGSYVNLFLISSDISGAVIAPGTGSIGSIIDTGAATYGSGTPIKMRNTHRINFYNAANSAQHSVYSDASGNLRIQNGGAGTIVAFRNAADDTSTFTVDDVGNVNANSQYRVGGTKVVGARGAAVTAPAGGATIDTQARTAINDLISRLQAHGLIS